MTFGSDYGIWEPKWQVEGFVDWQMPDDDEFSDYPKLTTATKKKILGLNAAKLYDIEVPDGVPAPRRAPATPPPRTTPQLVTGAMTDRPPTVPVAASAAARGAHHRARPGARRADHHPRLRRVVHGLLRRAGAGPAAPAHLLLRAELRLPHGRRRLRRRRRDPGRTDGRGDPRGPLRLRRDQRRGSRPGGLRRLIRRRGRRRARRPARAVPPQGGAGRHRPGVPPADRGRRDAGRAAWR